MITPDIIGGDIIICAGDITRRGSFADATDFFYWFEDLPYTHKILIAGNHDFCFEKENMIQSAMEGKIIRIPDNVIYLMDRMVEVEGIKIYGSPWQPRFYDWAFNVDRGEKIAEKWKLVPNDADIVVTHGPVYSILDCNIGGEHVGCEELRNKIFEIKPKIHVCGHIHEDYGVMDVDGIKFINASSLNYSYEYVNKPINIEYDETI